MSFGNDSATQNAILKEYYTQDAVENELFEDNAFLGLVPKKEDVDGAYLAYPIQWGAGMGRSADFAIAQTMAAKTGENFSTFHVDLKINYEIATISDKLLLQAPKKDAGSFVDMITEIADSQLQNLTNDIGSSIYRDPDGARARVGTATTIASSTVFVANPSDIYLFEQGMSLDVAAAKFPSGSIRAYGSGNHGLYVGSVDYSTASFTIAVSPTPGATAVNMNDTVDGCPAIAQGDYIYQSGDRGAKIAGLAAWLPATVAANDSFFNVNRSANRVRLAGQSIDGTSGQSIASIIERGMAQVSAVGGRTTHIFMGHKKLADFSIEIGAKQVYTLKATNAQVGYKAISVMGAKGEAFAMGDLFCPGDAIYLIDMSTWELISQGKAAHVNDHDGNIWLRSPTAPGQEIRFESMCNLRCRKPRNNAVIKVVAS